MQDKLRVGINGAGTIGRELLGLLESHPLLEPVAINDVAPVESLVSHLRRRGSWPLRQVELHGDGLHFGSRTLKLLSESDPGRLPWGELGVELVVEASGRYTDATRARCHLEAGARRVLVTAPSRGADATVVRGVSDAQLQPGARIVSAGSCTTNCVAPLLHSLHRRIGVEWGGFVSVHAATNDQSMVGAPGRAAARSFGSLDNAFATATGASKAVAEVLPELAGRLEARAVRVPLSVGSRIELWAALASDVNSGSVLEQLEQDTRGSLAGIMALSSERLAASDIRGSSHSSIVEAPSVSVVGGRYLMASAWYDNVSAFSYRLVEILERMAEHVRRELADQQTAVSVSGY